MTVRLTPAGVLAAEWTKLRSLRSNAVLVLASIGLMVGFGVLAGLSSTGLAAGLSAEDRALVDLISPSVAGFWLAQLTLGVLGVLAATGEYGTGQVRATFAAVPRRTPVVMMKAAIVALTTLGAMVPAALVAFLVAQALAGEGSARLSDDGALAVIAGAGLYLAAIAVLGVGIGWIVRNAAGAIAILMGMILVLPVVVLIAPLEWLQRAAPYLPSTVGQSLMEAQGFERSVPWLAALALLCLYALVLLAVAAWVVRQRDV